MSLDNKIKDRLTYDPESGDLTWLKIEEKDRHDKSYNTKNEGNRAGYLHKESGYYYVGVAGKALRLHRVAWFLHYGVWPKQGLDHINRVRSDNKITNLRDVSRKENQRNLSKANNNNSGVTGVCMRKDNGRWKAQIQVDGRSIHLGYFENIKDAIEARISAEQSYGFHKTHGKEI